MRATDLLGATVYGVDGKPIGTVRDLRDRRPPVTGSRLSLPAAPPVAPPRVGASPDAQAESADGATAPRVGKRVRQATDTANLSHTL
ncbi:PRC-barrel domain protein [Micromonospora pisi]|uniref:PRC-barrel domain protein n=1 Tax=Micromonospora pisi TaxID=589240 RepID=A0A495JTG8_9ACTN|nr:PRC-barrel domain-containing protein [Micromonospora pisi]RKR91848.1 PRC-barrel domain protein [Micromonospora pisi]